jgi:primosomal protein N' (replication factor Y) (superfamily II helicase)
VAKLRLKNPLAPAQAETITHWVVAEVAVDAPVPHLDGVYSYKAPADLAHVGCVVQVPFGQSVTLGFVIAVRSFESRDSMLKAVEKVKTPSLFDNDALHRYTTIAKRYGTSLISVLKLALPIWKEMSFETFQSSFGDPDDVAANSSDAAYLARMFGDEWMFQGKRNIQLPPGIRWEQVAVSMILADPRSTLVLVPTENALASIERVLRSRGIKNFTSISSRGRKSERHAQYAKLLDQGRKLLIGTRSAAFAPFKADRIIIIDPTDPNYREQRSPYLRADTDALWEDSSYLVTISHSRNLDSVAMRETFIDVVPQGRFSFTSTSMDRVVTDLTSVFKRGPGYKSILISINDKSFASGLVCQQCRNRTRCECGFPLRIRSRGDVPSCSKCLKVHQPYSCPFCGGSRVIATKMGGEAWAMTLARSIKNSSVVLSSTSIYKEEIVASPERNTIVIATQGCEPRLVGERVGYDIVILLGGRAAFNSVSISRIDSFRISWGRTLGFANPQQATFLVDLEADHPEFLALQNEKSAHAMEVIISERKALNLPPFATLVEVSGGDALLQKLRSSLLQDVIFSVPENMIFPVQQGKFVIRVSRRQNEELMQLLHSMTRIRSSRKLPQVNLRVEPDDM